jgi:DNA-binding transcriptional regulator/RsmH inhibitor MraZ
VLFCGQDRCLVDANGRIKLSPRFLSDFENTGQAVMLHCLPEGALGIYPTQTWDEMRRSEPRIGAAALRNIALRRELRRFGAMSQPEKISNQGRITIPPHFRALLALEEGGEAVVVGCEIGVEVWSGARWDQEMALLGDHEQHKAEAAMAADLLVSGTISETT